MALWRQVSRLLQVPKVRFPRSSAIRAAFVLTSIGGSCLVEAPEKPAGAATLDGIAVLADQRNDLLALPVNQAPATPGPTLEAAEPSSTAPTSVWQRNALFGNTAGVGNAFAAWGVTLGLAETSEELGNVTGGQRQGLVYEGLTQATIGIDLNAAAGWQAARSTSALSKSTAEGYQLITSSI